MLNRLKTKATIFFVALFSIAAGLVATHQFTEISIGIGKKLFVNEAPIISVFQKGNFIIENEDGYILDISEEKTFRIQITSKYHEPMIIHNMTVSAVNIEDWRALLRPSERPSHGSVPINNFVLKPTIQKDILLFRSSNGRVEKINARNLLSDNTLVFITSDITDALVFELQTANINFAYFCIKLEATYRMKLGSNEHIEKVVCFEQD